MKKILWNQGRFLWSTSIKYFQKMQLLLSINNFIDFTKGNLLVWLNIKITKTFKGNIQSLNWFEIDNQMNEEIVENEEIIYKFHTKEELQECFKNQLLEFYPESFQNISSIWIYCQWFYLVYLKRN